MNFDELTMAQARKIAQMFSGETSETLRATPVPTAERPVVICTDKRGVFFGYATDTTGAVIVLKRPQMCVYWAKSVKGVLGLAADGPNSECRVTDAPPAIELRGITCVIECSERAAKAWESKPWQ